MAAQIAMNLPKYFGSRRMDSSGLCRLLLPLAVVLLDISVQDIYNLFTDMIPSQSRIVFTIDVNRCLGLFNCTRPSYSYLGMARLSRSVHHTPHDSNIHLLHIVITISPDR